MELRHDVLDVDTPDGPMAILVTQPADDGPRPTVVIFHDAPAIRQAIRDFMAKLAAEGYRVATPDLYHRAGRMIGFEPDAVAADPSLRDQMVTLLYSLTDDGIQRDLDATLDALDLADDELLGTIGFCLGARAVVRTLTRLPDRFGAGATWHPSFLADDGDDSPHLTAADIARPLYIGIGTADKVQSIEMHQPFFDAVAPLEHVEVEIFDGADHGFTWPGYATYHQVASDTCFAKTTALFAQHLSSGG